MRLADSACLEHSGREGRHTEEIPICKVIGDCDALSVLFPFQGMRLLPEQIVSLREKVYKRVRREFVGLNRTITHSTMSE